jgi:hypothetical protein
MMVEPLDEVKGSIDDKTLRLNPMDWAGSCLALESTLHQLSPYIGKIKSTFARNLITVYTDQEMLF